jgi:hypothetical protein
MPTSTSQTSLATLVGAPFSSLPSTKPAPPPFLLLNASLAKISHLLDHIPSPAISLYEYREAAKTLDLIFAHIDLEGPKCLEKAKGWKPVKPVVKDLGVFARQIGELELALEGIRGFGLWSRVEMDGKVDREGDACGVEEALQTVREINAVTGRILGVVLAV